MIAQAISKPIETPEQHSLAKSIFMHLFPGVLIFGFYLLAAPFVLNSGYPAMAAMLLAILVIAIPVELGELYRQGKARNGRFSLQGIVSYCKPMPIWQYIVFTLVFLVLAFLLSGVAALLDGGLSAWLAQWLPKWFFLNQFETFAGYSKEVLLVTLVCNFLLNMLAAPVVEELYFRGFLLPRLARFGKWAFLINAALFTFYHFWQPYAYPSILLVMVPMVYLVLRKQSVILGIVLHCALNITGNLLLFGAILGQTS